MALADLRRFAVAPLGKAHFCAVFVAPSSGANAKMGHPRKTVLHLIARAPSRARTGVEHLLLDSYEA